MQGYLVVFGIFFWFERLVHGRRIEEYSMIGRTLSWVDDTNNWVPYSIDGAQVQIKVAGLPLKGTILLKMHIKISGC
jgi:hypothetical protein